ncbi:Rv3212 family protein [Allokutzneria oryzae]|uniref:PQQ-binding-like beta-propeller repeat protein n=1 Tax=Allokutzneria oryzae TaxID=1378989 RepID=A0ABV6A2M8_9PSEU
MTGSGQHGDPDQPTSRDHEPVPSGTPASESGTPDLPDEVAREPEPRQPQHPSAPPADDDLLGFDPDPDPAPRPKPVHQHGMAVATEPVAEQRPNVPARSFHRKSDYVAVALIVVAVVVAALVVHQTSDAAATVSRTTAEPMVQLPQPTALPPSFAEVWRAPSPATYAPVVAGPAVVTGEGGEMAGRDPLTGEKKWTYSRDLPLCTVGVAWGQPFAVYTKKGWTGGNGPQSGNCSEITGVDGSTGKRTLSRNGNAGMGTRLVTDGTHLVMTGRRLLEVLRYDLVKALEYGKVEAEVQPNKQPRTDCEFGSVAIGGNRLGVIERCPDDLGDRLTVQKPNPKDNDTPEVAFSSVLNGRGARLVAVTAERALVALPNPARLVTLDVNGGQVAEQPLDIPASDLAGDPPGLVTPLVEGSSNMYWFTGSKLVALSSGELRPQWTVDNAVGSPTLFSGRLVVPVPEGLLVLDAVTGARIGSVPVRREQPGPVTLATAGPVILEQRGGTLVALR